MPFFSDGLLPASSGPPLLVRDEADVGACVLTDPCGELTGSEHRTAWAHFRIELRASRSHRR